MTYYLKAKDWAGAAVIIRIRTHHREIEEVEEVTEEEMLQEIKEMTGNDRRGMT